MEHLFISSIRECAQNCYEIFSQLFQIKKLRDMLTPNGIQRLWQFSINKALKPQIYI